ncbi:MAG: guanylate kinase [Actinomycetia bacterium]|nr:guanylate kinase [Actinomycetes bacterium]
MTGINEARLFVISGPSGSGKSSLISDVLKYLKDFEKSVSATTRPKRKGETQGEQYHFITEEEFEDLIKKGNFLEWAKYSGYYYGTPKEPVCKKLAAGVNIILEIEVQGAIQIKEKADDAFYIFILTTAVEELRRRLIKRGTDEPGEIEKRLKIARKELEYKKHYDCIIVNNNYNEALQNLKIVLENEAGKGTE